MVCRRRRLFPVLVCILAVSLLSACVAEESSPGPIARPSPLAPAVPLCEVSLEEAGEIIGMSLVPTYLPPGIDLQRVFVYEGRLSARLFFSAEEITDELRTMRDVIPVLDRLSQREASGRPEFVLFADRYSESPAADDTWESSAGRYGGKVVDIDGTQGWLTPAESIRELRWFRSWVHLEIRAVRELPEEELIRIAASIGQAGEVVL